jgi:hypothetical protein
MNDLLIEELKNSLDEVLEDLTPSEAFAMGWRTAEDSFLLVWDELLLAEGEDKAFQLFKEFIGTVRELRNGDSA